MSCDSYGILYHFRLPNCPILICEPPYYAHVGLVSSLFNNSRFNLEVIGRIFALRLRYISSV